MSTETFDFVVFIKPHNSDSHSWARFEQHFGTDVPAKGRINNHQTCERDLGAGFIKSMQMKEKL